jgi:serine/threonine protein kinase
VIFYASEIIAVLDYLFRHNVVYRNLNSESILLDESGHIKLVGFSNAKIIQDRYWIIIIIIIIIILTK